MIQALFWSIGVLVALALFAWQTKHDFAPLIQYKLEVLLVLLPLRYYMDSIYSQYKAVGLTISGLRVMISAGSILAEQQLVMGQHHIEEKIHSAISIGFDISALFIENIRIVWETT